MATVATEYDESSPSVAAESQNLSCFQNGEGWQYSFRLNGSRLVQSPVRNLCSMYGVRNDFCLKFPKFFGKEKLQALRAQVRLREKREPRKPKEQSWQLGARATHRPKIG